MVVEVAEQEAEFGQHVGPRPVLDVLQGQEKDRALPLLCHVPRAGALDGQAAKERAMRLPLLGCKEVIEHGEEERLAEAARPRQQQDFPVIIEEVAYR